MKAILVDDEQLALELMGHHLNEIGNINVIGKYLNPLKAKEAILESSVDVVFLDINLPEVTGLELAEILLEHKPNLVIVFVTAYNEYAVEAFELNALDYVVKPVRIDRLKRTVSRVEQLLKAQVKTIKPKQKTLHVNVGRQLMIGNALGEFEKVSWRTARARELFLFLLFNHGQFIRKSLLIEQFWPDFNSDKAYSQLYSTIYLIRKTLLKFGDHFEIKNTTEGYQFTLKDVVIDLKEWERQLENAPPLDTKSITLYEEIMGLYTGAYLLDYDYLWAEAERYRLEELWVKKSLEIADWYHDQGHIEKAKASYKKISDAYPEVENASFAQMKIHAELGNHIMVFQLYDQLSEVLEESLDLPPRAEITTWFQEWNNAL